MQPADFIRRFSLPIIISTIGTGLYPSVKMAQAAIETGWGASTVENAKNLFGIKATGSKSPYWKGDFVTAETTEVYNGTSTPVTSPFRAYSTFTNSVRDHSYLVVTLPIYQAARIATTPEDQARALQAAGYATDPNYSAKIINIINTYDLKKLDKRKNRMRTTRIVIASAAIIVAIYIIIKNSKN